MSVKSKVRINTEDLIGKRLGELKVIGYAGRCYEDTAGGPRLRHRYLIRCECGTVKMVRRGQLTSERVHSCGCLRRKKSGNKNEKQ